MKLAVLLSLVVLLLGSCAGGSAMREQENTQWALVRIELDRRYLGNRGTLPLFEKPGGESFGMVPRAAGSLRFTGVGRVACRVDFLEPLMGADGRPSFHRYEVLRFYGIQEEGGDRLILEDDSGVGAPLGTATVLHVSQEGDTLRVQPATRDRMLPYVFHFLREPTRTRPIHVPYVN